MPTTDYVSKWIETKPLEPKMSTHLGGAVKLKETRDEIIDGNALAVEIQTMCNDLAMSGYEVISILSIERGRTNAFEGASHSMTGGVIITARKDG